MRQLLPLVTLAVLASDAAARDWCVAPGGTGDGSSGSPYGSIQTALAQAQPGDVVVVAAGTYNEAIQSVRAGTAGAPITVRGETGAIVTAAGRVLTLSHAYLVIEKLVLDGQYGDDDAVRIETAASNATLRDTEVRHAERDCVDMGSPANVTIEGCLIHHCLNATNGRTDAHGIVGAAVRDLTIRNTEIHSFSGDAVQFDPGRTSPGWDRVTIEGCKLWLAPLPTAENGFPVGTVAGENAVDTKVLATAPLAHLTVRDTIAYGFGGGLIGNMAAFNLKERVVADLDRVTIYDSEIALRLRFPANVTVANAVIHDVTTAVRYEDDIVTPRLYSSTFGGGISAAFDEASSGATSFDARNVLVLGTTLPAELGAGSLVAMPAIFADAAAHDYHLVAGAPAIDTGVDVPVTTDRDGIPRPQGAMHDVGAYEYCAAPCAAAVPDAGAGNGDGGTEPPPGTADGCCDTHGASSSPWLACLVLIGLGRRASRRRETR